MKQELQDKLFKKYPEIFKQKDLSIRQSCMGWGITCGDGWYNLLDILCSQVQHHIKCHEEGHKYKVKEYNRLSEGKIECPAFEPIHFEATQVKEKFGTLRFYYDGGDEYIRGLVNFAESMSYRICDICGAEGKNSANERKWYATRCGKH